MSATSLVGFDVCQAFDGVWLSSSNEAGIGWIVQHSLCLPILGGGAQACFLGSALQVELTTCLWALQMAIRRGFSKLLLYSDCSSLVLLISTYYTTPVSVSWLVVDLRHLHMSLFKFSVHKISRFILLSYFVCFSSPFVKKKKNFYDYYGKYFVDQFQPK